MQTFRDVIKACGGADALAAYIGVPCERVRKWRTRDTLPPEYWLETTAAARSNKKKLKLEDLAHIARRRRETHESSMAGSPF